MLDFYLGSLAHVARSSEVNAINNMFKDLVTASFGLPDQLVQCEIERFCLVKFGAPSLGALMKWTFLYLTIILATSLATDFAPTEQAKIVPDGEDWDLLWADGVFTEGPSAAPDGSLCFTDIGNTIWRKTAEGKVEVLRGVSDRANGTMFDVDGNLVVCEGAAGGGRRVSISKPGEPAMALADRWEGKRFNSPNDLTITPSRRVYFTDPRYGGDEPREIDFEGVYFVDRGEDVRLATRDVQKPNGIGLSPDGQTIYIADTPRAADGTCKLLSFTVADDGRLTNKKVMFDFGEGNRGIDGMTLDQKGRIYGAGGKGDKSGVYVFGPDGQHLAFIRLPDMPTNCVFGRDGEASTLYATAQAPKGTPAKTSERGTQRPFGLYRIRLLTNGFHPALGLDR